MVNYEIDSEAEQVLVGSLLGDGSLQFQKRSVNALFREQHSIKQKEYLIYKAKYLACFDPKIAEYSIFDPRTNRFYAHALLWTKTHPILTAYFKLLYKDKKKFITKEMLQKVDPLALAIWYCDDGSFGYTNQNAKIATYLSYADNKLLTDFLKERFNINCSINRDGKRGYLYFSVQEIKKFLALIEDYVPSCMNYKLGPFVEGNTKRLNKENLKRREKDKMRHEKNMADPIRRELERKWRRESQQRRMQNLDYRKSYNEYQKNWKK